LVEVKEIEAVLGNVLITLRERMLSFPSHVLPELNRTVQITPEQRRAVLQALKHFVHGWLNELSRLATVTAADAYVRYKLGEDGEPEKEESAGGLREEKGRRKNEKQTKRRGAAKEA
jgi:hypothetical protein